jgi:hypothetical protein
VRGQHAFAPARDRKHLVGEIAGAARQTALSDT